jgi:hypothetical protein
VNPLPPRLLGLHLLSRRTPLALTLILATAAVLWLLGPLTTGTSPFAGTLPLVLVTGAAGIIAASAQSPFGDPERATWPVRWLRLIHVLALVVVTAGLLGLARAGHDPLAAIRNLAGFAGLALLTTTVITPGLAWIAPLAYTIYCSGPLDIGSTSLWSWPALPSSDHTAYLIALALLGTGMVCFTRSGTRERHADPG